MKFFFYYLAFVLWKIFVRPFKRTPTRWVAIIFNKAGQFAVETDGQGHRLPAGNATPGYPIPLLCRRGLGLEQRDFTNTAPLRLIGIGGKGGEEITCYYSGELIDAAAFASRRDRNVTFIGRPELATLVPRQIANELR